MLFQVRGVHQQSAKLVRSEIASRLTEDAVKAADREAGERETRRAALPTWSRHSPKTWTGREVSCGKGLKTGPRQRDRDVAQLHGCVMRVLL